MIFYFEIIKLNPCDYVKLYELAKNKIKTLQL